MTDNKIITLAVDRSVHPRIYEAHQGEQLARTFTIQFSSDGNILTLANSDTVKADVMTNDELIDTINGTVNASANTATITLSQRAMCVSGILTIKVTLTNGTAILTAESILLRVTPTANKTYLTPPESDTVKNIINEFKSIKTSAMQYTTKTISLSTNVFTLLETEIASNSPVFISITKGGGTSTLVRADGVELIDNLTGKVIDTTMTKVEITADDVIAGIKLTEGGTLKVKYYNKECENLISELSKLEIDYNANKKKINVEIENISDGISSLQNRYSETSGKNIFQSNSIVEGKFLNYTNGSINTNADYFYTQNAVEVEPDTTYTGSWYNTDRTFNSVMTAFVLFYNLSDEFISGIQLSAVVNGVFTTPENCYYIRYSGKLSTWNTLLLQIEKGSNYSESYEEYYKSTLLKDDYIPIDYIKSECNKRSYIYVDKKGNGDYTTITEAVANAEDGATVVVAPGKYENEIIEAWGKEIHIIGVSKESCIISNSTATYSTPPIEIGKGSLENLTIIAEYGTGTSSDANGWLPYAVHTEDNNLYNGVLTISNCTLISELNASLGLGMRGGCTVNLKNTQLIGRIGTDNRALYFHDAASSAYAGEQNINIVNCLLESDSNTTPTIRIVDQCVDGSKINLTMINTLVHNSKGTAYRVGASNADGGSYGGWRNLKNTTLSAKSFGNNIEVFNA